MLSREALNPFSAGVVVRVEYCAAVVRFRKRSAGASTDLNATRRPIVVVQGRLSAVRCKCELEDTVI